MSLPRARGFTVIQPSVSQLRDVSPPCAGVYRPETAPMQPLASLSPVRGGLPPTTSADGQIELSLPRARGFTGVLDVEKALYIVSPPCAGVYRQGCAPAPEIGCLSPVRGGLPVQWLDAVSYHRSLRRAREFTDARGLLFRALDVSPPCAGVYRRRSASASPIASLSPVRGGLPPWWTSRAVLGLSLPRARGFTDGADSIRRHVGVSPPCAGVYRRRRTIRSRP